MSELVAQSVADEFADELKENADQLRNTKLQAMFFSKKKSFEEIWKLFTRSSLREQLQGMVRKKHSHKDWVPLKSQMDWLATLERDVRYRYRSRLDNYRAASLGKKAMAINLQHYTDQVGAIGGGE